LIEKGFSAKRSRSSAFGNQWVNSSSAKRVSREGGGPSLAFTIESPRSSTKRRNNQIGLADGDPKGKAATRTPHLPVSNRHMSQLTKEFVREALDAHRVWDRGNAVLYKLCADHPGHTADDLIVAKTWLIGRAYAAAVERRRHKGEFLGDAFYENMARTIREANIDSWLRELGDHPRDGGQAAIVAHKKLTRLLNGITGSNKRSFASKYLHFHFPAQFYIYDSRADKSARTLTKLDRTRKEACGAADADQQYVDSAVCRFLRPLRTDQS
jgi:hypothetical protein